MNSHQYFVKQKKETRLQISEILTFLLPYHVPKTNLIKWTRLLLIPVINSSLDAKKKLTNQQQGIFLFSWHRH